MLKNEKQQQHQQQNKTNKKKQQQQQQTNVSNHSRAFLEEKNAAKIQVNFFENGSRGLIFQSSSRL